MTRYQLEGRIVNPFTKADYYGQLVIADGKIESIAQCDATSNNIITCGFIDAHVHIESSLLPPREYARLALRHGVIACMADPHEIANVCGIDGVKYMIELGRDVPFYFFWGASPCVPATEFETTGGKLNVDDIKELLNLPEVTHLAEVMNWPGVVSNDPSLMAMISYARLNNKPIDAHAPGLEGMPCWKYFNILPGAADHECFSQPEAIRKIQNGAKIAIREGSAAKNFAALQPLLRQADYQDHVFFCADDAHPDFLSQKRSYIPEMVRRAVEKGTPLIVAITTATANPINHYKLPVGRMNVGDIADLIVIKDHESFEVIQTFVGGNLVYDQGEIKVKSEKVTLMNNFHALEIQPAALRRKETSAHIKVIGIQPGELITDSLAREAFSVGGYLSSNPATDILKYVVLNRYIQHADPAIAFVHGMGLKRGAIASSVGHDSHNIGCVGVDDISMARAINLIIKHQGGLTLVDGDHELVLPLPIAGLMSDLTAEDVTKIYTELDRYAKEDLGSTLPSPFMTLSFLCLTVIKSLKLSDRGLFDGDSFKIIPLEIEAIPTP